MKVSLKITLRFIPRRTIWNYNREIGGYCGLIDETKLFLNISSIPPLLNYIKVERVLCRINITTGLPISSKNLFYLDSPEVNSSIIYMRP